MTDWLTRIAYNIRELMLSLTLEVVVEIRNGTEPTNYLSASKSGNNENIRNKHRART